MARGLGDILGELHPFHRLAREEIADLVASQGAFHEAGDALAGSASGADPFLPSGEAGDPADLAPAQHILLQGPAGSGKRGLAQALRKALEGKMEVRVVEADQPVEAEHGLVVWISRDGKIPRSMPARTPRVRVRSLSSSEKARLLAIETGRMARSYGLDPLEFPFDPVQRMLRDGGFPEAGVLGAVQRLQKLCRRRVRELSEGTAGPVDAAWVERVLGPQARPMDPPASKLSPGAVHAPVVSPLGGAIALIEAFASPGGGRLSVTGAGPQSEVAAQVARSRCLALAQHLRVQVDALRDLDWHVHVSGPEGPKDGVSIGWPVLVAMASHLSGVTVDARFAFTGELTLSGGLKAVGFAEEKFLACEREGFRRLWMPDRNVPELSGLEPEAVGSCEAMAVHQDLQALRALGIASARM